MAIGAAISVATIVLQAGLRLISTSDWHDHKGRWILSGVLPFGSYLLVHLLVRAIKAPYLVYTQREKQHEQELANLRRYKEQIQDKEVKLAFVRCNRVPDVIHIQRMLVINGPDIMRPLDRSESLSVTFENPRNPGVPGKIAENVLAKITYTDSRGQPFHLEGRWNQLDQPAGRGPTSSTLDLLRMTFYPGDERHLDVAAKFADGLFAYNNESQFNPKRSDRLLVGASIQVTVELIAEFVHQTFDFEIRNPQKGPLELVVRQPTHSATH